MRGTRVLVGITIAIFVALVGCKKKDSPILKMSEEPRMVSCATDADCRVIALDDCCHCCQATLIVGVSKEAPDYHRECGDGHCKVCVGPGAKDGKAVSCETNPKPTDFAPKCSAGKCTAVKK